MASSVLRCDCVCAQGAEFLLAEQMTDRMTLAELWPELGDLGQITSHLWAAVAPSVKSLGNKDAEAGRDLLRAWGGYQSQRKVG